MSGLKTSLVFVLAVLLTLSLLFVSGQMPSPPPVPGPVTPPPGPSALSGALANLTTSQNYSAARASSYNRQGGPRDNYWIPSNGEEVTLAEIEGPGEITHIWMTHRSGGRDLIIRMYWDGSDHPSVEAPIGDFFGVAMGINAVVNSIPIQNSSEGRARNCWWLMPFNTSARITATATKSEANSELETVSLYFYIDYRVFDKPVEDIHYFHARFNEIDPAERGKPVTFLEAEGDGHFVGVVMGNRIRLPGWFGEGDDIITVDGKISFLGTGSEDYFCDGWGFRVFSSLYHGVPALDGREPGDRLSAYRFHILDPIPFRRSFKFEIEHWPWISPIPNTSRDYFSSVAFWYQKRIHKPWPRLENILSLGPWDPDKGRWHVSGALEAEDLGLAGFSSAAGPNARPTVVRELPNLSGDHMLLFDSGGKGEFFLDVPVDASGEYTIGVYFVRAPEYAIVRLTANGNSLGDPVDTFLRTDDLTRPIWPPKEFIFPGVALKKGLNRLGFSTDSKNPDSDGFKVGLDCLVLKRSGE